MTSNVPPSVAVDPVDAGGEWSSGSSEGHTLAIELSAPTLEAALARAVEGFADVLGEVHPSVTMDQHELAASGTLAVGAAARGARGVPALPPRRPAAR